MQRRRGGRAGGIVVERVEDFVERLGPRRAIVANRDESLEKPGGVDHAGGHGQLALVVLLLGLGEVLRRIIQIHAHHIGIRQRLHVRDGVARRPPMPRIEHETHIAGAKISDEFTGFRHRVHKGIFFSDHRELRADILQPEAQPVVLEDPRDLRQPRHVHSVVGAISQLPMARSQPRADSARAGGL